MLWEIRGTRSGKTIRAKVAASSEESARRKAAANGVAVTSVTLLEDPSAPAQAVAPQPNPEPADVAPEAQPESVEPAPEPYAYPPAADVSAEPYAGGDPAADPPPPASPQFAEPIQYATAPQYTGTDPAANKFGGMSIASLVCACVAVPLLAFDMCCVPVTSPVPAIVALILGIIAWRSASRTNNRRARAMAMAGTFTSIGVLVLVLGKVIFLSYIFASSWKSASAAASQGAALQAPALSIPALPVPSVTVPIAPTSAELTAKLQRIDEYWQPSTVAPTDLMPLLKRNASLVDADGTVNLNRGTDVRFSSSYKAPVTFRIVLLTDDKETRISYGNTKLTFNSDKGNNDLRVEGGQAGGHHKVGAGRLPYGQWTAIEWVVHPDEMIVYVDGSERHRVRANFSKTRGTLDLDAHGGALKVKSLSALSE